MTTTTAALLAAARRYAALPYDAASLVAQLADALAAVEERRGCPCLYTSPCDPACTCIVAGSSRGCARCASYGSPEQRRGMAEAIVSIEVRCTAAEARLAKVRERAILPPTGSIETHDRRYGLCKLCNANWGHQLGDEHTAHAPDCPARPMEPGT